MLFLPSSLCCASSKGYINALLAWHHVSEDVEGGSVGAEPLCLGTWGALEPCSPFPGSQLEPVWNQFNGSQGVFVNAGPDAVLVTVSCSPWVALGPVVCPVMHYGCRQNSHLAAGPRCYRPISSRSGGVLSFRKDGGNGKGSTSSLGKYSSSEFISWRAE